MSNVTVLLSRTHSINERLDVLDGAIPQDILQSVCLDEYVPWEIREKAVTLIDAFENTSTSLLAVLACCTPMTHPQLREEATKIANNVISQQQDYSQLLLQAWTNNATDDLTVCTSIIGFATLHTVLIIPTTDDEDDLFSLLLSRLSTLCSTTAFHPSIPGVFFELMASHRLDARACLAIACLGTTAIDVQTLITRLMVKPQWQQLAYWIIMARFGDPSKMHDLLRPSITTTSQDLENIMWACIGMLEDGAKEFTTWRDVIVGWGVENSEQAQAMMLRGVQFEQGSSWCWATLAHLVKLLSSPLSLKRCLVVLVGAWLGAGQLPNCIPVPWRQMDNFTFLRTSLLSVYQFLVVNGGGGDELGLFSHLRTRLKNDLWKSDWIGACACVGLFPLSSSSDNDDDTNNAYPLLLAMADDVDPRVAVPSWHALLRGGPTSIPKSLILVMFDALERSSSSRDPRILRPVLELANAMLVHYESGGGARPHHVRLLDKIALDASHLVLLDPVAYCVVVDEFLIPVVRRMDVACVRILPKLLEGVMGSSGLSDTRTSTASLNLLLVILKACDVRVAAHRQEIFAGLLRARLLGVAEKQAILFASVITTFKNIVKDNKWWTQCVDRVRKAGFEDVAKTFDRDAELLDDVD